MGLELAGLIVVQVAYLAVGVAFLVAVGWVTADSGTWHRLGVAYLLGLVVVVVPSSYLALLEVPVGWSATTAGVVVIAAGIWRGRGLRPSWPRLSRPSAEQLAGFAIVFVVLVLLAYSTRTFLVRPLVDWDSWAVWAAKARLLYADPSLAPAALRSGSYGPTPYPIGLPTLQALGFGAMGRFDGTLIGLQFILLAFGFVAALWSVTRNVARPWMVGLCSLVVFGSPQMLYQLLTHYADVPLGLFVGIGLASGGAWVASSTDEQWLLGCFAAFFGMAGITKSEGLLFALAGGVALLVASLADRRRLVRACAATALMLGIVLPWRIYCSAFALATPDYDLRHVVDVAYLRSHSGRAWPAAHELVQQLVDVGKWGYLAGAVLAALVVGLLSQRKLVVSFAAVWLILAFGGLVLTYWISTLPLASHLSNSSYRTIVSLLIGGAALIPLFVFPRPAPGARARWRP